MAETAVLSSTDPYWRMPVLAGDDRLMAGVAASVGREVGLAAVWVRIGFIALAMAGGWGVPLYALGWWLLPTAPTDTEIRVAKGAGPYSRLLGLMAVVASVVLLFIQLVPLWAMIGLQDVLLVAGLAFLAVAVSAPWWLRLVRNRDLERQARVRSEERADVAAHLHDSVLQTLSLIQRNADDPQAMVNLARRQERELRNWLDPDRASRVGESVRGQVDQIATDVEDLHGVPVEVVVAGDCLVDDGIAAALDATREATVNAAKHSGAEQIDIYVEVAETVVEFFVRDGGCGFVRDRIDGDRRGVRESIIGRMERAGGSATVVSEPGEGTEVEISVARSRPSPSADGDAAIGDGP